MDALVGFERSPTPLPLLQQAARWAVAVSLLLLATLGFLVLARRWAGALTVPLPGSLMVVCGLALALAALGTRRVLDDGAWSSCRGWLSVIVSASVLVWGLGLSSPEQGTGVLALWGVLLVEEGWSWGRWRGALVETPPAAAPQDPIALLPATNLPVDPAVEPLTPVEMSLASADDASVSQNVVRRRDAAGFDVVEGWQRVELAAGQRQATAHVAICPALDYQPTCYVEQIGGAEAQIKVAQMLPYGVRFELKLGAASAGPQSVTFEFSIVPADAP